jgi:small-conductance mechanosensitive channel/CRP-like cAMP-binding protein
VTALFHDVHISWAGFGITFGSLIAVLFLRRLLSRERVKRGRPAVYFLALSLVIRLAAVGAHELDFETVESVLAFIAILFMGFGVVGVAAMLVFDIVLARVGVEVPPLVRDLIVALILAVISLGILRNAGLDLLSLITTSAVLTAVIGLALQSTISNLFAGLALQTDRSIAIGDWVETHGRVGRVSSIRWRSTYLVTKDGDSVILPNSYLLQNDVVNFTRPTAEHRMWIKVGFAYRHPPNEVRRVLLDAVRNAPGVLASPAPDCFPTDFGDNAITYALRYWITEVERDAPIDGEIRARIWYAAQREQLEIPYPTRSVYLTEITEEQKNRERAEELEERIAAVRRIELFAALQDEERALLAKRMQRVNFARGEEVIRQGDPGDSLYVILRGSVVVKLSLEKVMREVATLGPGDFFGEMSLITGERRTATCAAVEDTACFVIDHIAFQRLLDAKPAVAEQIATRLGMRQAALEGERDQLSADARAKRAAEKSSDLLNRIKTFFNLA